MNSNNIVILSVIALALSSFALGMSIDEHLNYQELKKYKQKVETLEKILEENGLSEN